MTPKEILIAADALLSDESVWCKDAHALDEYGEKVPSRNPHAARWDVEGAIAHICQFKYSSFSSDAMRLLDAAAESRGFDWAIQLNDAEATTFTDIKSLFAAAIKEVS